MGVDLVITDARWLEPCGATVEGHIVVEDGRLRLLRPSGIPPQSPVTMDGHGLLVLPGGVDAHTHFREPGAAHKEGIWNGSRAALKGGITTVLDMPNNRPPITTEARLARKRALFAQRAMVNWGLHVLALPRRQPPASPYASGKVYMARASTVRPVQAEAALRDLMATWPVLTVHGEDEAEFVVSKGALHHHERRPRSAIVQALATLERALEGVSRPARLVLCHVSTVDEVRWLARQKARGFDVWGETCPHYCIFTQGDYLAYGAYLQVNPPLRTEEDRAGIVEAVATGVIDFVSSDHAPHTPEEKAGADPPSGIAGIEWMVPVTLSLVDCGALSWACAHAILCANAATCFGVRGRDGLKSGNAADLMVLQRGHASGGGRVQTRAEFAPYESVKLQWEVRATVVNGRIAYRDGSFVGAAKGREVIV